MGDMKDQVQELKEGWTTVYEAVKATPAASQPYLSGASPEQINEVVQIIVHWLGRAKAPAGFAPAFHVAKGLCGSALNNLLPSLKALQRAEYNHFPNFLAGLNQVLVSLHSMIDFSSKDEGLRTVGDMASELTQGLALVGTAQRELKEKLAQLEKAEEVVQRATTSANIIQGLQPQAEKNLQAIDGIYKDATETLTELAKCKDTATEKEKDIKKALEQSNDLQERLSIQAKALEELNTKSHTQQELIAALLPKGASAGLAWAFGSQVGRLERTKLIWMGLFIVSIAGLAVTAYTLLPDAGSDDLVYLLLRRLPLAAPLIWLGWFSAIQYGNSVRVQEDYAFKEATSKAFAGYKDHMEHMASVELDEAKTAMTMLAEKTIEILAREPLRIFQKAEQDASPARGILEAMGINKSKVDGGK